MKYKENNHRNSINIFRLLRIARNKQVKEVADELMVTTTYINAIENGIRYPSKRLLRDYARVLEVDEKVLKSFNPDQFKNSKFENVLLYLLKIICDENW